MEIFCGIYCRTVFLKGRFFKKKSSIRNIKWNHSFGRAELYLWLPDFEHLGMLCNKLIRLSLTVL